MQFFLPKFFWATLPGTPPKWGPKTSIFWTAQARVLVFFDISMYSTNKYFDIVWGLHPPGKPPKNQFFERLKVEFYFFLISVDI